MLNMKNIAKKSSSKESPTVFWMPLQFSEISDDSIRKGMQNSTEAVLMWLAEDSPVNPFPSQESVPVKMTPEICGLLQSSAFASYDHASHSWRTSQASLLTNTWEEFSETWPRAGIVSGGHVWEQTTLERITEENDFGFWPTPRAGNPGSRPNRKGGKILAEEVKKWPTPRTTDSNTAASKRIQNAKEGKGEFQLREAVGGGKLNPTWVEWLMGWPSEWTDLKPSETDKFQSAWLMPFQSYLMELLGRI